MPARSELAKIESAAILRCARITEIKRRAFGFMPVADGPREPLPRQKKPRAVLVFPPRYARMMRPFICLRVQGQELSPMRSFLRSKPVS
jgi:hypothetical protein